MRPRDVLAIEPTQRPGKKLRCKPGDVVAVPAGSDAWFLGVVLTRNRFGTAFGFVRGRYPARPLPGGERLEALGPPILLARAERIPLVPKP